MSKNKERGTSRTHGHTMALGCCSATTPCAHQQRDPDTICDICAKAATSPVDDASAAQDKSVVTDAVAIVERVRNEYEHSELVADATDYDPRPYAAAVKVCNKVIAALRAVQTKETGK